MFGKRRRAASNPPQRAPPAASASASLAATKAFLRDRESNGDLSSAAAAAALRTHVTTPTPVGDTLTKRMIRRGSASSNGSSARPPPHSLRRQSSSGSMTERSFRAPSPGRTPAEVPPPVPPVPQHIAHATSAHRRASSLEPVYRAASPGSRGGGRGSSLDRGANAAPVGRGQRPASHLAQVSEEEDAATRSVNFSRPMSPGASAPKQNPSPPTSHGWFAGPVVDQDAVQRMASSSRPRTSGGVPLHDLQHTQRQVQNAADRPVKTHLFAHGVQGARLSSGSMRAKPSGPAASSGPVDPKSPNAIYDPSTRTFIHKQAAMARHRELHEQPEPTQQYVSQHVDDYRPHHAASPARPRSPSPVRQPVPRDESSTQEREAEAALSRSNGSIPGKQLTAQPAAIPSLHTGSVLLQRQRSEDLTSADIQIPEQANTGLKLDMAFSSKADTEDISTPNLQSNQDSAYPYLTTPAENKVTPGRNSATIRSTSDQNASLSLPRIAHFAPVAVELAGVKHEPLPRASSPAKSALKSSPSVSRRTHSPVAPSGRMLSKNASSEVSDATSDEGTRKQKRNVRVSFDEKPIIAGTTTAAEAEKSVAPPGLSASRWSPIAEKENEFEDFMKPRPALPSFGSIRDSGRRSAQGDMPEKVTETVTASPMSASIGSIGEQSHVSSDHALGAIVAQELAQASRRTNDPVPPEVTTVEGSGYVSDSSDESGLRKHGEAPEPKSLSSQVDDKGATPAASIVERTIEVPEISLLPATPSPAERSEPHFQSMLIPGGWSEEMQKTDRGGDDNIANVSQAPANSQGLDSIPRQQTQPQPSVQEEDDLTDDNSSVYSDAYEDLSDTEGGFASIDALMRSPAKDTPQGLLGSKYADTTATDSSASNRQNQKFVDDDTDGETTPTQDWDATKQHWSGLTAARKESQRDPESAQRAAHTESVIARVADALPVVQSEQPSGQPQRSSLHKTPVEPEQRGTSQAAQPTEKPLKSALKKTPKFQPTGAVEPQMRTSMRGPASRQGSAAGVTHMKQSMRGAASNSPQTAPGMRASMRGGSEPAPRAQAQMRRSMRGDESSPMGLAASRHSTISTDSKPPRGALQKRHLPAAAPPIKPRPQSVPVAKSKAPVPTYDSDSDASASSFQRSRSRGARNQGGQYTMRGSMRQGPAPSLRAAAPAPKQVRAISPPGSPTPALRKSLRPSSPTPEVVKSSKFSIRSLSPMGRFRNKGSDARPSSPTPAPKQTSTFIEQQRPQKQKQPIAERAKAPFQSRFADSSDEDDDQPRRFQSRFADSDDDEPTDYKLPPGLAPVRGIPKRTGEEDGDSTDLEEEAEEKPRVQSTSAANHVNTSQTKGKANGEGKILASGSLRDSKHAPALPSFEAGAKSKTKRGFFGLGKKKSTPAQNSTVDLPALQQDIPLPPSQRNRDLGLPLTPIDEDRDFDTPATSPAAKKSPKLQRRSTPDWPLPPPPFLGIENRPMSSDGVAPRRPRFQKRQSSQISNVTAPVVDTSGRSVSYGKSGKKKKFQGLRRVFGLND
ncbi:hypothetical protein ACN47E_004598 [Coniothyrium glycines]